MASIRSLPKGNTEVVAEMIADMTGGDLFEIDTVQTLCRRTTTRALCPASRWRNFGKAPGRRCRSLSWTASM